MGLRFIYDSKELEAVVLAMRIVGPELRKQLYQRSRDAIAPEWQSALSDRASTVYPNQLAQKVLVKSARVNVTSRGVTLTAAKSQKKLSGGLTPKEGWPAVEFGASPKRARITANRDGKSYTYKRTINTQFPKNVRKGLVAYPTGRKFIARYASLWVFTVARTLRDAAEGRI